ncbi:MAG TPA: LysM peptidoglycan-binding domain-containing protein [Actinomycetota bacterium]|nr:LysM peptidoglycan-binding domain-containing protein [Actinomycetota bacterium]
MGRTRVRRGRAAVLVGLVAVALLGGRAVGGVPGPSSESAPVERYLVRPGDTLWEIARVRLGPEADPRPFVDRIRELSGLETSVLRAGEVLLVPLVEGG